MSTSPAKVDKPTDPVTADAGDDEDVDPKTFDLPKRKNITLATDKKFEQKYDSLAELGKGKFGVVKKVKNKETGEVLAAKFIKTSAESKKEVLGEMEMMNHLHSKRLIYLADAYERPGEMIVIMELVTGGELFEKICQDDNLTEKEVIRYMRQILQGVEHMHRNNMVHLDLKPENVLCVIRPDGKEDLKLIDFGMAHILEKGKELKLACGTPEFVAPEVISYEPVHLASDMWSIGVIAYVLLSGLSPFMGDDDNETIMNVSSAEWDFEDESFDLVSDLSKKFIEELLLKDYSKRSDVYHCLGHEWLKKGKTLEAKKLSTDNLKKFIARRRWQKTSNALRALSRLGSLGLGGGGGGGGGGGLLGKMKGKLQTKQENRLTQGESRGPPEVSMAWRRSPTLSGRRGPVQREANHGTPAGPPSFRLPLKDCEIVEGTAARFQCQVTGNPEPDVEWYKDGKKLRESKQLTFLYDENDNCKLIITEGRQKDAGEYKVVAVNRHGKVSCSAKLIIKEHASSDEESGGEASDSEISDDATDDEKDVGIRTDSITKFYKIKDELGKGRFGVVCKCSRISDGKCFAAKFIKCSKEQEKKDVKHEIEIMSVLRHRRLLRLADAFESPTEIVLVMELVTGGELFEKVVEDEFISENDVIHYMKQIIEGVQHMHSREVLHLDLKPENIMIVRPDSRQIKLIDFGLARKYDPKENLKVMFGTPEFVAPEVLTYDRITPATDMWSIGVIAYVLLSGLSPFMGDNDAETLANVQTAEWDFDDPVFDDISDDAKDFISKLLVLKATKRITVEKCLKHAWLTEKRETGKRLKTDRLKAFTAKRKWKKALTAIRSTNFLSRLMGSRGASDGTKKANEEEGGDGSGGGGGGGGGGGLLARVKAMHSAGVQAPGSGPSSSPFLSPSSAENATPSPPATTTKSTTPSSKSPTTTTAPSKKEPTPTANKTETKPSTKTDSKPTPSNLPKESKVTDTNGVSSKATESNNNISNKEPEKATDRTKTPTPTSPPKTTLNDTKNNSDSPSSTRPSKAPTSSRKGPGKLPVWPPPPKERAQKREIQELVEKYSKSGIPLTPDNPENEFDIKDEIDRGKFAVVKKCGDRETKKIFAAKLIKFDEDEENETVQEFDVHRSLKHKSLVTLFSAYIVQKYLVLVMELFEGEDALSFLASKSKVTEDDVTSIIKQVLDALEYLHRKNILHLDIRPANILVSQNTVKLIDFGCARRLTNKEGEVGAVVGNTEFSAPEMLLFEPVSSSSDMWSLGVTLFLLLSAELPFSGDDEDMVAEAVKTGTIMINDDLFPSTTRQAKDFVKKLLSKIPRRRIDATTAKSHDWLSLSFGRERRKTPAADPRKYKEILDELLSQEEDELITASCVLRTFEEEPYESSDDDEDDGDD